MNWLKFLKFAPFLLENQEAIRKAVDAALATKDKKVIEQYDAWTAAVRWPVLGFSTVTGLDAFTTDAAGEAHVAKLFGGDKLVKLRELFEAFVSSPIALALLRAWLKV